MFALYKISTGWDGSMSTLFGIGSLATAATSMTTATTANNNIASSQDDHRNTFVHERQNILPDGNYATGQATILTRERAQKRLVPNLVELIEANNQLDDEDASTMESGILNDPDEKQASGSDNHFLASSDIISPSKVSAKSRIMNKSDSPESLVVNVKNRRDQLANLLALEDHRLAELEKSGFRLNPSKIPTSELGNQKLHLSQDEAKRVAKMNEDNLQQIDDNEQQDHDQDSIDGTTGDDSAARRNDASQMIENDSSQDSNQDSNDQGQSSNDDSDESNARQAGLAIDEEVDKLTKPSLEFTNQEEDSEYGNEAVRFDDNPNTSERDQHLTAANKNRARHQASAGAISNLTIATITSSTSTTTAKPPIKRSPQYIVHFNDKNPPQESTNQDLHFDHNKPAVSLMSRLKTPRQQQQHHDRHRSKLVATNSGRPLIQAK